MSTGNFEDLHCKQVLWVSKRENGELYVKRPPELNKRVFWAIRRTDVDKLLERKEELMNLDHFRNLLKYYFSNLVIEVHNGTCDKHYMFTQLEDVFQLIHASFFEEHRLPPAHTTFNNKGLEERFHWIQQNLSEPLVFKKSVVAFLEHLFGLYDMPTGTIGPVEEDYLLQHSRSSSRSRSRSRRSRSCSRARRSSRSPSRSRSRSPSAFIGVNLDECQKDFEAERRGSCDRANLALLLQRIHELEAENHELEAENETKQQQIDMLRYQDVQQDGLQDRLPLVSVDVEDIGLAAHDKVEAASVALAAAYELASPEDKESKKRSAHAAIGRLCAKQREASSIFEVYEWYLLGTIIDEQKLYEIADHLHNEAMNLVPSGIQIPELEVTECRKSGSEAVRAALVAFEAAGKQASRHDQDIQEKYMLREIGKLCVLQRKSASMFDVYKLSLLDTVTDECELRSVAYRLRAEAEELGARR